MCTKICREINPRVVAMSGDLDTAVACLEGAHEEYNKPSPDRAAVDLLLEEAQCRFQMGKTTPELNRSMNLVQEMCDSLMLKVKSAVELLANLEKEQVEIAARAEAEKGQVKVQMEKAARRAFWGFLGSIGIAVVATTVVVGVTVATGGAAAPIVGFVGAHMAYIAGGAAVAGVTYGIGKAYCEWMKPVDDSALREIQVKKEKAKAVQEGAQLLQRKYQDL